MSPYTRAAMRRLVPSLIAVLLAFAANAEPPSGRTEATIWLAHADAERRAEAVAWIATHGAMKDAELLHPRLRDEHPQVRVLAERALWIVWSRSGDAAVDKLLERGIGQMQSGDHRRAIATFTEVIRRKPAFAEGWNKRATALFFARDYRRSLADCDEVLKRNPGHFGALSGIGQNWFALDEYEKARDAWKRALEVNPNMPGVEANIEGVEALLRERRGSST